jgi:transcriptional regulator with XRE-family HTH domain
MSLVARFIWYYLVTVKKEVDNEFIAAFGKHLVDLRTSKGLTQLDLCVKADVPRSLIGRIERGEVNTTIDTSKRIATALEVKVADLFQF